MVKTTGEVNAKSVGAAFAAMLGNMSGATFIASSLGIFAVALTEEFGWSRTAFYAISTLCVFGSGLVAPFAGRAIDRWGARRVLLPGVAAFALGFLSLSFLTGSLAQFAVLFVILGMISGVQSPVGYKKVVSQWFSRHRGLALALVAAIGVGTVDVSLPQLARWFVSDFGWRHAYQYMALTIALIGLPIPLFMLREPKPEDLVHGGSAKGPIAIGSGLTLGEAMRTPTYWLLAGAVLLSTAALQGTATHLFPVLTDRGFNGPLAATVMSLMALGSITGQLTSGFFLDRVDSPRVALPFFAIAVLGAVVLHFAHVEGLVLLGGFLMGAAKGSELGLLSYFCTRYFGLKGFGALYGTIYTISTLAAGLGMMLSALSHDRLGSYMPIFIAYDIFLAVSFLGVAMLKPYAYSIAGVPIEPPTSTSPSGGTVRLADQKMA